MVASFAATGEVQVADWRAAAAAPGVLGRDGTHATGAGYALRASLLAEAVQGCLVGGGASGIPAPRDPDVRVPRGEQRDAGRPGRAAPPVEPAGPRARPVRLPVPRALVALAVALRRMVSPVAAALRDARTAATKGEPEPVLGRALGRVPEGGFNTLRRYIRRNVWDPPLQVDFRVPLGQMLGEDLPYLLPFA